MRFSWALAGWLAAAFIATLAGVAVLGLLGGALSGSAPRPLSAEEVGVALAAATPRTPAAQQATPAAKGGHVLSTEGGTVVATCSDGRATLKSWSPAQGYVLDDVDNESGHAPRVEFDSDADDADVKVEIRCDANGVPFTVPR